MMNNNFHEVEGEEGIFEIRKMKIMYEIVPLEIGYLIKDSVRRKTKIIKI